MAHVRCRVRFGRDAWRKFVKGLAAMEDLGTSPDDERVKQLVVDAREAAKRVRLALN